MFRRYLFLSVLVLTAFGASAQETLRVVDTDYYVMKKESFNSILQKFSLGRNEVLQANPGLNPGQLIAGQKITLPLFHLLPEGKKEGIVINLAELRLYYFFDEDLFWSFPVTIGSEQKTPTGKTKISGKRENPFWIPPQSIREENPDLPIIVPPGPNNPLGNYALEVDASKNIKWHNVRIHGTNDPKSIGTSVSHGCIRLYPKDIEQLFNEVEIGTPVTVVNQPVKFAELEGKYYLEVHMENSPDLVVEDLGVHKLICSHVRTCDSSIDWSRVDEVVIENRGVPVDVGRKGF